MGEYTLVKKSSLGQVAEAIRQKGGTAAGLKFPDGFVAAIMAIETTPPAPTTETLTLAFVTGETVTDSSLNSYSNYVVVGHSSSKIKQDAVWSFTPGINAKSATFTFKWDNSIGAVGWPDSYSYRFQITANGTAGQALTGGVLVTLSGESGTATVEINGLSLVKGTTYYIRANYKDYETNKTLKAFLKAGNTVKLTA